MPAQALNVLPGAQREFGRYHLLCRFATGGMANLYLARLTGSQGFEKLVAIKRIHEHLTENEGFLQMFVDEARLCAKISHPNVVQVIELGQIGTSHYIVMEYVEGESLAALMRNRCPTLPVAARIVASAAAGLHAAHTLRDGNGELLRVVHRDVSPQNILVSYDGAVKLVDFGVARARSNLHTTSAGQMKGKFAYMAPEQVAQGEVDARTDVFALGIVLWELITGHRLFKAFNDAATVTKVREMEILPARMLTPECPPALEAIAMRALERDPRYRFQDAQAMEEALDDFLMQLGTSVQQRHVGEMMHGVFGDRIEAKRQLLIQCEESKDVISATGSASASPSSTSLGGPTMTQARAQILHQRTQRRNIVIGTLAAISLAAATVVLIAVFTAPAPVAPAPFRPPRVVVEATPPPTAAPIQIKIRIKANPARARITVDGTPVVNPYDVEREASDAKLRVTISAEGHLTHEMDVPLSESGNWVISLEEAREEPRKAGRKRGGRRKLDRDLFGDPYGD